MCLKVDILIQLLSFQKVFHEKKAKTTTQSLSILLLCKELGNADLP